MNPSPYRDELESAHRKIAELESRLTEKQRKKKAPNWTLIGKWAKRVGIALGLSTLVTGTLGLVGYKTWHCNHIINLKETRCEEMCGPKAIWLGVYRDIGTVGCESSLSECGCKYVDPKDDKTYRIGPHNLYKLEKRGRRSEGANR
jgi:hypothetical protein